MDPFLKLPLSTVLAALSGLLDGEYEVGINVILSSTQKWPIMPYPVKSFLEVNEDVIETC